MEVSEVIPDFASAFSFDEFNAMQREAVPAILESDENVVAGAPTASGKTAIAELAICKTIKCGGTALYIAPLRALTNELEREWNRFEDLGYSVYVVTGERDLNTQLAGRADVLVMTPEKVDSATRDQESHRYGFLREIDCCVIDEVQLLDSATRGSALEVTVARLRRVCDPRIIALSATMANIEDVATWLDAPDENTLLFDDQYRPVKLNTGVKTYNRGENAFADKYRRLYRALDLIEPHLRDNGQGLVFVASRQDTVQAAEKARDELDDRDVGVSCRGEFSFHEETRVLSNEELREVVLDGVAFHHAGLSRGDKNAVERWFREGRIKVLFSTSTLAWGVNLPARCVVIRDTKLHDPLEGDIEMSPIDVLQMIGRAGRPDYDSVGYGWVICPPEDARRYRQLLTDGKPLESRLAEDLDRHLVAEIARGTITELDDVDAWLETTFYAVRARSDSSTDTVDRIHDRVRSSLNLVMERGFVQSTSNDGLEATLLGQLASKFYLDLDTAETFLRFVQADECTERAVVRCISEAAEFASVRTRRGESTAVNTILEGWADNDPSGVRKVIAILWASMADRVPGPLADDAWIIRQNALRLITALCAFCERFGNPWMRNQVNRVEARLEHGVRAGIVGLTAINGVGQTRAQQLANAGFRTPCDVQRSSVRDLEQAGLSSTTAETVLDHARSFPAVVIEWGSFSDRIGRGESELREITIRSTTGAGHVAIRVSVNGVEMTTKEAYLTSDVRVPIGVFGADEDLEFRLEVTFPTEPIPPVVASRPVSVV